MRSDEPVVDMLGKDDDTGALFSRAPLDDALAIADKGRQPMSIVAAKVVIGCVHAQFTARAGAAPHIAIKPVRQRCDLPASLQDTASR